MRLSDFDFELPEERVALRPVTPRDQARLLHVMPDQCADRRVYELLDLLHAGDLLVINNTRVIPSRLKGVRRRSDSQAMVELTLIACEVDGTWRALAKPAKRLKAGDVIECEGGGVTVVARDEAVVTVRFDETERTALDFLKQQGTMPIPPYIAKKRGADDQDVHDYQTMFAQVDGAVAAPTAGLHFTPQLVSKLQDKGVEFAEVTLHVGAGTFLPLDEDRLQQDRLHSEWGEVSPATIAAIVATRSRKRRVIPVGTTSLRILESAARAGTLQAFSGNTDIFIKPGYGFKVADALITNFHLPQSSLFMLVCAFSGRERMKAAYAHAVAHDYRFYSYGDACLLERIDEV